MTLRRGDPTVDSSVALNRRTLVAPKSDSLCRDELINLLYRLSDDVNAFLDDLGLNRESSGNRESTRCSREGGVCPEK
jgi:hypothetical protein